MCKLRMELCQDQLRNVDSDGTREKGLGPHGIPHALLPVAPRNSLVVCKQIYTSAEML